jgi:subtilisin family serine protease
LRLIAALLAVCSLAALSGTGPATPAVAFGEPQYTGGVIVKFRHGVGLAQVGAAIDAARTDVRASSAPSALVLLSPEPGQSVDEAVAALNARADVEFAEPDVVVSIADTPNDPGYAAQQWHYPQIGLPAAWDVTTGSTDVIIAILDTGVDLDHPDLDGKITSGANAGWDYVNNDSVPDDDHNHGTFVAGIAAAESDNGSQVAGVCWQCKIMPVKVLGSTGSGSMSHVAFGVDWARTHGADVINMSLGAPSEFAALETAIQNARAAGIVVVGASGNDNAPVIYPAAYDEVIAVGANTSTGARASFSNFGPELDVMAPGQDIASTTRGGGWDGSSGHSGTSYAAPHVAGLAGLLIADGMTDPAEIQATLQATATDMGSAGFDTLNGWGRVDAAAALGSSDTTPPTASITSPANNATVNGNVAINASASDSGGIEKVRFWAGSTYLGYDASAPYSKTWSASAVTNGRYTIKIEALDNSGNSTVRTISVKLVNPDSTPPTVNITAPADGASVSGLVTINATASDSQGLEKVQFWAGSTYLGYDTTSPFSRSWNTAGLPDGSYSLRARAIDWAGNATDDTIVVSIGSDSTPPTVALSEPDQGEDVSGTVTISASASDNAGVDKVRLWIDGVYQGYDWSAPYTWSWDTTALADGPHTVRVQAIDLSGNASASVTHTVNVNN